MNSIVRALEHGSTGTVGEGLDSRAIRSVTEHGVHRRHGRTCLLAGKLGRAELLW